MKNPAQPLTYQHSIINSPKSVIKFEKNVVSSVKDSVLKLKMSQTKDDIIDNRPKGIQKSKLKGI